MASRRQEGYTIGAGAGFAGDRVEPAVAMAASGEVDAVILECLAERTLVNALRARQASPEQGYDPRLRRRLALELGISDVRVASVVGDDVSERVPEIAWTRPVEDGEWLGAHVYLGVEPIVAGRWPRVPTW